MSEFDRMMIQTIQSFGDGFFPVMKFFTVIGKGQWYFIAIILIAWCWDYRLGARLGYDWSGEVVCMLPWGGHKRMLSFTLTAFSN